MTLTINGTTLEFLDNVDGGLTVKKTIEIPDEFVDECRALRFETMTRPYNEMALQVRLPSNLAEELFIQGHLQHGMKMKEIKAMLNKLGLDVFIIDTRSN